MRPLVLVLVVALSHCFYIAVTPSVVCLHFKKDSEHTSFKFQVNAEEP